MNTSSASHWTRSSGPSTIHGSRPNGPSQAGSSTVRARAESARALSASPLHRGLRAGPGNRPLEAVAPRRAGREPEQLLRARSVEAPPRLAVRHRLVPGDPPREPGQLGDQLGEVADRDLLARADVDRLLGVVAPGGERERLGGVLDE